MIIPDRYCNNNNNFLVKVNTQNVCKTNFTDNLWLPFLDQPQSDVFVFVNNVFLHIQISLVT